MSATCTPAPGAATLDRAAWHAMIAGLSGSLVAIGLARFAYTPLIPPLIEAHWFSASDTVTLGAANLAGYLAGALLGRPIAAAFGNRQALRLLMLIATIAFFACAWPLSVAWFFGWRFASGLAGGAIMVLVATAILPHIPPAKRGFAGGMIFLGLGLGITASGTLVPTLLQLGLRETWFGLGLLALLLSAVSWSGWPAGNPPASAAAPIGSGTRERRSLGILYVQYAANALGLVPAMVLLVDYVARGLGQGAGIGAGFWVLYGLASIAGPVLSGQAIDRIGAARAYRAALLLQVVAVAALALSGNLVVLAVATVILGLCTPGIVPLALARVQEILPHSHVAQRAAWSRATTAFALFQAIAGYGYAAIFTHTGQDYRIIFLLGTAALVAAFLAGLIGERRR